MPFIAATALLLSAIAQDGKRFRVTVQNLVELTPGFEMHGLSCRDVHGLAGTWIVRFARISMMDTERTKAGMIQRVGCWIRKAAPRTRRSPLWQLL